MKYSISGCADYRFPVVPYYGLLWYSKDDAISIAMDYPLSGNWGEVLSANDKALDDNPVPMYVSACWLSLREERFYFYEAELNINDVNNAIKIVRKQDEDICFVLGMGAMGKFTLWLRSYKKSIILKQGSSETTFVPMDKFMPIRPDLSKRDFCKLMLSQIDSLFQKVDYKDMSIRDKQFTYRYNILLECWDNETWTKLAENDFEDIYVSHSLADGTHDKLHDGGLFAYHSGGCPERISIRFQRNRAEFEIHLFINNKIRSFFERFYGAHPDTKTDFVIRIDPEKRKYELALFRQGLKEPVVISESAYQLIVFKNKFEDYRSENYTQPHGAWIW